MIEIKDIFINRLQIAESIKGHSNIICIFKGDDEKQLDYLNPEWKYVVYFDYQDYCNDKLINKLIKNDNILKIFATNLNVNHPKCVFIPLGISLWGFDFSHMELNEIEFNTDKIFQKTYLYNNLFNDFLTKQKYLQYINKKKIPIHERKKIISLDFKNGMEKGKIEYVKKYRQKCFNKFINNLEKFNIENYQFYFEEDKTIVKKVWDLYSEIQFVVSPRGNGVDCHRTYEALVLGAIPIIEKTDDNWQGYENLEKLFGKQIIFIDNYENITPEFLNNYIEVNKDLINNDNENVYSSKWIKLIKNNFN